MNIQKLTTNFIPQLTNLKNVNYFNKSKTKLTTIPVASTPLLAYYIGQNRDEALARLLKKMKELGVPIPSSYHPDPSKPGLSNGEKVDFRRVISNSAKSGKITETEKNDLFSKVSFTGNESDIDDYIPDESDSIIDSILDFLDDLF